MPFDLGQPVTIRVACIVTQTICLTQIGPLGARRRKGRQHMKDFSAACCSGHAAGLSPVDQVRSEVLSLITPVAEMRRVSLADGLARVPGDTGLVAPGDRWSRFPFHAGFAL